MENLELKYEDAIKEFEEIVSKLSSENISFDDSLKMFKRGEVLAKFLKEKLEDYSGKIFEIKRNISGEIIEEEMEWKYLNFLANV